METEAEVKQFRSVLTTLLDFVVGPELMGDDVAAAREDYRKGLEYTNRLVDPVYGQMVVWMYRTCSPQCSQKQLHLAHVLGWCMQIWRNSALVAMDTLEKNPTRNGKPAWHSCEGIGILACLDSMFYMAAVFKILKKYFRGQKCYVRLIDSFEEAKFREFMAVREDIESDWRTCSREKCQSLNRLKSEVYTHLPLSLVMILIGVEDDKQYEDVQNISGLIGLWQQEQNNYLDVYSETKGADIEKGRCTWLLGEAMVRGSKSQLEILKANYGQGGPRCVAAVTKVYDELKLRDVFAAHQLHRRNEVLALVDKYRGPVPKEIFLAIVEEMKEIKTI